MGRTGTGIDVVGSAIRVRFTWQGKRRCETLDQKATPANLKYAERLRAEIVQKINLGIFVYSEYFPDSQHAEQAETHTFGELAQLWLDSVSRLTGASVSQYKSAVNCWQKMFGADTPVKNLSHKVIKAKIGKHAWPTAKTHNNYLIALRGIFELEYSGMKSFSNPMIGITNLKTVKKLPDPLTITERDKILADMEKHYDPRIAAYFRFAFFTGMRPEELIALRWSDIDFRRGTARVQRVRTFKGSERDGTKTFSERDVDLVKPALDSLQVMKRFTYMKGAEYDIFERPDWRPSKGSLGGKPSEAGPWHDERSQRETYWQPTLRRLGIRMRRAYNTRHTYCTAALMGRVNPAYIASQAGHSVKILLEKYARWIPGTDGGTEKQLLDAALQTNGTETVRKNQKIL